MLSDVWNVEDSLIRVLLHSGHEKFTNTGGVLIQYLFKSSAVYNTSSETCHEYFRMLISASQKDHLNFKKARFHERWQGKEMKIVKIYFKRQREANIQPAEAHNSPRQRCGHNTVPPLQELILFCFPVCWYSYADIGLCNTTHWLCTEANKQLSKLIPIPKSDMWFSQRVPN